MKRGFILLVVLTSMFLMGCQQSSPEIKEIDFRLQHIPDSLEVQIISNYYGNSIVHCKEKEQYTFSILGVYCKEPTHFSIIEEGTLLGTQRLEIKYQKPEKFVIKSFKLPADLSKFEKQENLSSMDLEVKVTESVCDGTYLKKWESVEPNVITEYHDRDCSEVFQTLIPTVLAWDSYREALNKLSSSYFEEILINGKEMYEISGFPGENLFDTLVVRFDFVSLFPLFSRISTRKNIESNGDTIKILNEIEEEIIYSEEEFNIKNVEFSFSSRVNAKNVRIIE